MPPVRCAGKERLFLEAARVLQRKIYVSVAKRKVWAVGSMVGAAARSHASCACVGACSSALVQKRSCPQALDCPAAFPFEALPSAWALPRHPLALQILDCLELPPEYAALLTTDDHETNLHAGAARRAARAAQAAPRRARRAALARGQRGRAVQSRAWQHVLPGVGS